jgi:hypothetical protein
MRSPAHGYAEGFLVAPTGHRAHACAGARYLGFPDSRINDARRYADKRKMVMLCSNSAHACFDRRLCPSAHGAKPRWR